MTDEQTPREKVREAMAAAMAKKCLRPNGHRPIGEPCAAFRHYAEAEAVLDAIKEAGGKVLMPNDTSSEVVGIVSGKTDGFNHHCFSPPGYGLIKSYIDVLSDKT